MKTTEITVQLCVQELEELLYDARKHVKWSGNLPITIRVSGSEQVLPIPYEISIVKEGEWE